MADKERFTTRPEQTAFSFITIRHDGWLEWANDGFRVLRGCDLETYGNLHGRMVSDLYPSPEVSALFRKCREEMVSADFITEIGTEDGSFRPLHVFLVPALFESGHVSRLVAIEMDMAALGFKERELQTQVSRMEEITRNLEKANLLLEKQKEEINNQKRTIEQEQQKSEKILLNIFPFEVAKQLKSKGRAGTRHYKLATVAFADFKGFSKISKTLEPTDLVNILDSYFAKFDEMIEKHYLEKIKTIGDAYMFAGGIPLSNKSNPIDTVLAAIEIQHYMNTLNDRKVLDNEPIWELRIGVHTGPVVAGVVGKKRLAYDIWGDTVNIASRMEQSGHVGMVNVSGVTYGYIKDFFDCDYRGKIETKDLGRVDMYFVNRIRPEYSADHFGIQPNEEMLNLLNRL